MNIAVFLKNETVEKHQHRKLQAQMASLENHTKRPKKTKQNKTTQTLLKNRREVTTY